MRHAGDETLSDRIANNAKHDRDGVGCLFQCGHNHRAAADDKVRCGTYQLRCVGWDSVQISTVISIIDSDIAVLNPSRSEEHTSELQSLRHLVCRLLLEEK